MKEASDYLGKPTKLRITNFSGDNKVSKEIYINDFWKGDLDVLRTLFYFDRENEGTVLDIDTKDRQTDIAYFIGTDGELNHSSHVTREAAKIKKLASKKSNNVFYFEIDGTFGLGKEVKKIKDAYYKRVSSKGYLDLLKEGINVFMHRN